MKATLNLYVKRTMGIQNHFNESVFKNVEFVDQLQIAGCVSTATGLPFSNFTEMLNPSEKEQRYVAKLTETTEYVLTINE